MGWMEPGFIEPQLDTTEPIPTNTQGINTVG